MAHHFSKPEGSPLLNQLREEGRTLGLGATRAFPNGVVNDLDEGEIAIAIKGDAERELVFVNFGKSIDVIGMTPQQAIGVAQELIRSARAVATSPVTVHLH